jgi:hypothetical protein
VPSVCSDVARSFHFVYATHYSEKVSTPDAKDIHGSRP